MSRLDAARTAFRLPPELSATGPAESGGRARDTVRLLVARPESLHHARFRDLGAHLHAGDLLVVNTSATRPSAVDGALRGGRRVAVHLSTALDDGTWVVELREAGGSGRVRDARCGDSVALPDAASVTLLAAHPDAWTVCGSRLWRARVAVPRSVDAYLAAHGRPITYGHVSRRWPLSAYQTVFARQCGSAEMPSAGRPFTHRLVTELVSAGVLVAPVLLHTGVSSLEAHEAPQDERYDVPVSTARLVAHVRSTGGRVIAVGTTAARALETAARPDGTVVPGGGWTGLVLGPGRPVRVLDGLLTGWHAPDASHLLLLEAVAGERLVQAAYDAALEAGYLWHEFGDTCLFLPGTGHAPRKTGGALRPELVATI